MTTQNEPLEERLQREEEVCHVCGDYLSKCKCTAVDKLVWDYVDFRFKKEAELDDISSYTHERIEQERIWLLDSLIEFEKNTIAETKKAAVGAIEGSKIEPDRTSLTWNDALDTAITAVEGVGKNENV